MSSTSILMDNHHRLLRLPLLLRQDPPIHRQPLRRLRSLQGETRSHRTKPADLIHPTGNQYPQTSNHSLIAKRP